MSETTPTPKVYSAFISVSNNVLTVTPTLAAQIGLWKMTLKQDNTKGTATVTYLALNLSINCRVTSLSDLVLTTDQKKYNLYDASKTLDLEFKKKIDCDQVLPSTIDYLDLVANKISYLPSWLSNLFDLNYLNLNYNELTYIPSGIFRNMKNLQYVYLSMNHLFEIKSIYPLSTLIYLDIKMQRSMLTKYI